MNETNKTIQEQERIQRYVHPLDYNNDICTHRYIHPIRKGFFTRCWWGLRRRFYTKPSTTRCGRRFNIQRIQNNGNDTQVRILQHREHPTFTVLVVDILSSIIHSIHIYNSEKLMDWRGVLKNGI